MVPVSVDWQKLVRELHRKLGSYDRVMSEMAKHGAFPDAATLSCLKNGYAKRPCWTNGAALLNVYEVHIGPTVPAAVHAA